MFESIADFKLAIGPKSAPVSLLRGQPLANLALCMGCLAELGPGSTLVSRVDQPYSVMVDIPATEMETTGDGLIVHYTLSGSSLSMDHQQWPQSVVNIVDDHQ